MRRRICVRLAKVGQFHGAPYNVLLNVNCLPPPLYVQITPSVSTFEFSPPLSESTYLATSMSSTTGVDPLTSPVRNIWHGDFLRRHHRVHRWWGCGGVRKKFTTTLPKPTVVGDGNLKKLLLLKKRSGPGPVSRTGFRHRFCPFHNIPLTNFHRSLTNARQR